MLVIGLTTMCFRVWCPCMLMRRHRKYDEYIHVLTYTHKDRIYKLWYAANCLPIHYGIVNCIVVCRHRNEILFEVLHKLTSERATQKGSHEDKARCVMGIVTDSARDLFIYMFVKDKKQFVLTHCIFIKLPSARCIIILDKCKPYWCWPVLRWLLVKTT